MSGGEIAFFIATTAVSIYQQQQAQDARQNARQRRQEIQKEKNFRRKVRDLRKQRAARAQAVAQGAQSGADITGTSAVQGTTDSIRSQSASNISFLEQQQRAGEEISGLLAEAQEDEQQARLFGTLASNTQQASTIFDSLGTFDTQPSNPAGPGQSSTSGFGTGPRGQGG